MNCRTSRLFLGLVFTSLPLFSIGCGGSSSVPLQQQQPQNGTVNLTVSDASTEDWATIGVKVLSVSLTPQGGGAPITVYTAPSPAPLLNLVELDQLSEILANVSVPVGTYTSATLTISGNPGDVLLTASADPEVGFQAAPGSTIPSNQIQIMGTTGAAGGLTVPVNVKLVTPLVVTASQSNALDLEFDLSHPAFIVAQVPPAVGTTIFAVNFNGPVRHHRIAAIDHLLLRHIYGTALTTGAVSADNTSLSIARDFPVEPPTNPETEITSAQMLTILADGTNGTLFYDLDAKTKSTIMNFSSISSTIGGKFIRVAARYQVDGSLVAVRMYASTSFNSVWISPEGHVLHVKTATNQLIVENELGIGVPVGIDANTQFFFRTPANAQADATPIGTGTAFLANVKRGFKVHVSVVDAQVVPFLAQSVDIEIARFDGSISAVNLNSFTYTHKFRTATDDYSFTLPFISPNTANGSDPMTGAAIAGFKWWNFTFPTVVTSGSGAITAFDSATDGTANFGGNVGAFPAAGESYTIWNDPAAANTWAAPSAVLLPTTVPLGVAATGYSNGAFTMAELGGAMAVPVDLSTTSGSATLVYQIDRTNNVVSISPVDITTSAGQTTISTNLVANTPVKVFGVPQADGSIKGYVVFYFTGTLPSAVD